MPICHDLFTSLYIKRGKVSVRSSVTLGVASSVANDVIMTTGAASAVGARRANDVFKLFLVLASYSGFKPQGC